MTRRTDKLSSSRMLAAIALMSRMSVPDQRIVLRTMWRMVPKRARGDEALLAARPFAPKSHRASRERNV